jgi:hypothetical protein
MKWATRLAKAVGILLVLLLVLVGAAVAVSNTQWFRDKVRAAAENQAARFLNGTLSVGAIEGNLVTGSVLKDVRIVQDGQEVVAVDEVRLSYKSWELVRSDLLFRDLTLTRPRIRLIHDGTRWRLANLLRLPERRQGPGRALRIPGMEVRDGTLAIERASQDGAVRWPARIEGLNARLSLTIAAGVTDLDVDRATFLAQDPALAVSSVSGRWTTSQGRHYVQNLHLRTSRSAVDGSFSYLPAAQPGGLGTTASRLSLSPVDFQEFAGIVPALDRRPMAVTGVVSAPICSSTSAEPRARFAATLPPSGSTWPCRSPTGSWPAGSPPKPTWTWRSPATASRSSACAARRRCGRRRRGSGDTTGRPRRAGCDSTAARW